MNGGNADIDTIIERMSELNNASIVRVQFILELLSQITTDQEPSIRYPGLQESRLNTK